MAKKTKLTFELSDGQIEALEYMLCEHCDCGPRGEQWKSNELESLNSIINQAIEGSKTDG